MRYWMGMALALAVAVGGYLGLSARGGHEEAGRMAAPRTAAAPAPPPAAPAPAGALARPGTAPPSAPVPTGQGRPPRSPAREEAARGTRFEGSTVVGWYAGQRQWEITADEVRMVEEESLTYLRGIREGAFFDGERVSFTVTAREGEWHEAEGQLILRGDVRVVGRDGRQLEAAELIYDSARRAFRAPAGTRLRLPLKGRQGP